MLATSVRACVAVATICGCDFYRLSETSDAGAELDAAGAVACYGPESPWQVCLGERPSGPSMLPLTIDTTSSPLCLGAQPVGWTEAGQPASCFIVAGAISVLTTTVIGSRPLVLVADQKLEVTRLDVSSHVTGAFGPGSQSAECRLFEGPPSTDGNNGSGGGAGGSFTTAGGPGGPGAGGNANGGGAAPTISTPGVLRGGCSGQLGAGHATGNGGAGGGVVYLVAGAQLTITGMVNASGAGGGGGIGSKRGGSGGGSGGMIVVFSPATTLTGTLMANGGGGGAGATMSVNGMPGADPTATAVRAPGGTGPGGSGGVGYAAGNDAVEGSENSNGGGGGGGGGGYIRSNSPLTGTSSPSVDVVP